MKISLLRLGACAAVILLMLAAPHPGTAAVLAPAQTAETIRTSLLNARLDLLLDPPSAHHDVALAQAAYSGAFATFLSRQAPQAAARVRQGLAEALRAVRADDSLALADAAAQVWTALLAASYGIVIAAIQHDDGRTAQSWLALREFRTATRFSRPTADATVAVNDLIGRVVKPPAALEVVRVDLLDTYQARLSEALSALRLGGNGDDAAQRVQNARLAAGYFAILAPAYQAQHGAAALARVQAAFAALCRSALARTTMTVPLAAVTRAMAVFRAAPLSAAEIARRAGQLGRFLSLVPVEYARGVQNGVVTRDLEVQEAATFRDAAAASFADLQSLFTARDPVRTARISRLLDTLAGQLAEASAHTTVPSVAAIQATTDRVSGLIAAITPPSWRQTATAGDFDVIGSLLDQMETAVAAGQYEVAESARLEAYAVLESGPEARLIIFAPQFRTPLENLFWYGRGAHPGLAGLLEAHASLSAIKATRSALDRELAATQAALPVTSSPGVIAANAGIIVFREGLEAVLILAALLGSMTRSSARPLRRPIWYGVALAGAATVLTWLLAQGALTALARFGDRLEAIISLVSVGVLLLITNWFFHKTYWTGHLAGLHARKARLLGASVGQWLGLVLLGFTSVYREGVETVLFLQSLVLDVGTAVVLGGVAVGLLATLLVGVAALRLQARLPYKKMLVATGLMIGLVLLTMVGHTIHVMQIIGWVGITPLGTLTMPAWLELWIGVYATWQSILWQAAAAVFVAGSYLLAERLRKRRVRAPAAVQMAG